jgi:hypothetical protein
MTSTTKPFKRFMAATLRGKKLPEGPKKMSQLDHVANALETKSLRGLSNADLLFMVSALLPNEPRFNLASCIVSYLRELEQSRLRAEEGGAA